MAQWKRIFTESSIPWVFAGVLAGITGAVTQLDTYILKSHIVETRLKCISVGNRTYVRANLVNTSNDKMIPELEVTLTIPDPDPMIKYLPQSHALSVPSPSRLNVSPMLYDKDFKFIIAEFQPYTEILASALIVGMTEPKLVINSPKEPVQTRNKGVLTLFLKNRLKILLTLLFLYVVFGFIYVHRLS